MNKQRTIDRLEFLLPYSNTFCEELRVLHREPQDKQLGLIEHSLNELVESNVKENDWPREMRIDPRFRSLLESFEELKDVRNLSIHQSKTLTHDEYMDLLTRLYEYGQNINWLIKHAIDMLSE
jgi:hypothetical protein